MLKLCIQTMYSNRVFQQFIQKMYSNVEQKVFLFYLWFKCRKLVTIFYVLLYFIKLFKCQILHFFKCQVSKSINEPFKNLSLGISASETILPSALSKFCFCFEFCFEKIIWRLYHCRIWYHSVTNTYFSTYLFPSYPAQAYIGVSAKGFWIFGSTCQLIFRKMLSWSFQNF